MQEFHLVANGKEPSSYLRIRFFQWGFLKKKGWLDESNELGNVLKCHPMWKYFIRKILNLG